jgi:hypothetical protein
MQQLGESRLLSTEVCASAYAATIRPNNRFEPSRGRIFDEPRRKSMVGINRLPWSATHSRVAQPHR